MIAEWLAVVLLFAGLVFGLYLIAHRLGRQVERAERSEESAKRSRRRGQIDADVARMSDPALDRELRGE